MLFMSFIFKQEKNKKLEKLFYVVIYLTSKTLYIKMSLAKLSCFKLFYVWSIHYERFPIKNENYGQTKSAEHFLNQPLTIMEAIFSHF